MTNQQIQNILKIKFKDNKQLFVNGHYICKFSNKILKDQDQVFNYSKESKNCPRIENYAEVVIYECKSHSKCIGKIMASFDKDLGENACGMYSMSLLMSSANDEQKNIMINATECMVEDNNE